jgi:hypothetical protein
LGSKVLGSTAFQGPGFDGPGPWYDGPGFKGFESCDHPGLGSGSNKLSQCCQSKPDFVDGFGFEGIDDPGFGFGSGSNKLIQYCQLKPDFVEGFDDAGFGGGG